MPNIHLLDGKKISFKTNSVSPKPSYLKAWPLILLICSRTYDNIFCGQVLPNIFYSLSKKQTNYVQSLRRLPLLYYLTSLKKFLIQQGNIILSIIGYFENLLIQNKGQDNKIT